MKKVAICVPSSDMVHADFAMSLAALVYHCTAMTTTSGEKIEAIPLLICNAKGSLVVNNRNTLVEKATENGVDYLFFVDSDIVMHPLTLRQLISADKDIVGGTYIMREQPHRILGKLPSGTLLHDMLCSGAQADTSGLMEMGCLPGGCLLVKASVFAELQKPYFQTPAHVTDGVPWIEGEDYFFCRTAREHGFEVWLDWNVSVHLRHIGQAHNTIPVAQREEEHAVH